MEIQYKPTYDDGYEEGIQHTLDKLGIITLEKGKLFQNQVHVATLNPKQGDGVLREFMATLGKDESFFNFRPEETNG